MGEGQKATEEFASVHTGLLGLHLAMKPEFLSCSSQVLLLPHAARRVVFISQLPRSAAAVTKHSLQRASV